MVNSATTQHHQSARFPASSGDTHLIVAQIFLNSSQAKRQLTGSVYRHRHMCQNDFLVVSREPKSTFDDLGRLHCAQMITVIWTFPVRLATYGACTFSYASPTIWHSLPINLTDSNLSLSTFKRRLKSFLFYSY